MKAHTTFRIGGPADYFVDVKDTEELMALLSLCREDGMPWHILGNGSNLLVADRGVKGVVIRLSGEFEGYEICREGPEGRLSAGAGIRLAKLAKAAAGAGLSGLAFAGGIPGTLGGALVMNAGAYGGEMSQVLSSIQYLDQTGIHTIGPDEARFDYRNSRFMQEGSLVLGAVLHLKPGDRQQIQDQMQELARRRKEKQQLEYPSAGSMFKRPEGYFAGKLIQDAGLSGFTVGGAKISEKHCGFVVNTGAATAQDVRNLVRAVHDKVWECFGVRIWPEVRYLGEQGWEPMLAPKGEA